jgi:uncharacterized protein (TIGR03067 family)
MTGRPEPTLDRRNAAMKRTLLLALAACLLVLTGQTHAEPGKDDAKKIQGKWTLSAIERDGKEVPLPPEARRTVTITADKLEPAGQKAAPYKLGVEKKLGTIDVNPPEGKVKTVKGLYELEGDTLKICFPARKPGEEGKRPEKLTSEGGRELLTFKRQKP